MELNSKILKIGLMLVTLALILNIGFSLIYRLEEPVFLKMYVDQDVSNNSQSMKLKYFKLNYISNVGDNRKITKVEFENYPEIEVFVDNGLNYGGIFDSFNGGNNNDSRETYGRYIINTIYINIDFSNIDKEFDEIEINSAKIRFNDGSTMSADLGRIIVYNLDFGDGDMYINRGSLSLDGTSNFSGKVEADIELINVKSDLLEGLNDSVDMSIGNNDYREVSGTSYKKGETISGKVIFRTSERIENKYTIYDIRPKIYYKNKEGEISYERIYNIDYKPYDFNFIDIIKYLKLRGAI